MQRQALIIGTSCEQQTTRTHDSICNIAPPSPARTRLKHMTVQAATSNCATIEITGIYPGTYEEVNVVGLRADYQSISSSDTTTSATTSYGSGGGATNLYFESSRRRRLVENDQRENGVAAVENDHGDGVGATRGGHAWLEERVFYFMYVILYNAIPAVGFSILEAGSVLSIRCLLCSPKCSDVFVPICFSSFLFSFSSCFRLEVTLLRP